ncbi:hypothetical protein [Microcoleus anatoxicus]|uniref:Uncharacterized protein n=1 Tax=Microcoleus anatoxicus PTRS2 TaxID=2705321 RepID=A0ABU8YJ12_9CYAN
MGDFKLDSPRRNCHKGSRGRVMGRKAIERAIGLSGSNIKSGSI